MLWVIDALAVFFVVVLGLVTSYEDIKFGKIRNKWVVSAIVLAFALLGLKVIIIFMTNYTMNVKYFTEFFMNFVVAFGLGVLLWEIKLWNAADAKLFLAYAALIPLSVYQLGYVNKFPSFVLIINTFVPCFLFYVCVLIIKTSTKYKLGMLKQLLKPSTLISYIVFIFAFEWLITLIFGFLNIKPQFLLTTALLFVPLMFFERVLKVDSFKFALGLTVLRLIFDYKTLLSLATLLGLVKTFLMFFILRYFLLSLGSRFFSTSVKIKDLKPGMMLAEEFYKDKKGIKKRGALLQLAILLVC